MKEKHTPELIGEFIGAIIGLVVVNSFAYWRGWTHGVVLDSWVNILWAANLSLITQLAGYAILVVYRPARLYSFIEMLMAATGLISVVVFYQVFPVDFSQLVGSWLNVLLRVVMILGIIGSAIAILVHLIRTVAGTQYKLESA
jgi:hypothetical protein